MAEEDEGERRWGWERRIKVEEIEREWKRRGKVGERNRIAKEKLGLAG